MCSIPVTCRPCLCTICTARAPEAVGTFRTNEATRRGYNPELVTPNDPPHDHHRRSQARTPPDPEKWHESGG